MKESFPSPDTGLTTRDRTLITQVAKSATRPMWKHAFHAIGALALFSGLGAIIYSVPYLMKTHGLRVCERHGSQWFPLAPTPEHDFLERLLWSTGAFLVLAGLVIAGMIWFETRRIRRVYELLSKALPASPAPPPLS
jgi:hypothetical protein